MGKSLDPVVFRSLSPIPHMNPTCGAKMASGIESHCCLTGAGDRHVTCLQPCVAAPCMHVRHRVVQNTPIVYYSPFCDFSGVLETNECKKDRYYKIWAYIWSHGTLRGDVRPSLQNRYRLCFPSRTTSWIQPALSHKQRKGSGCLSAWP